MAQNTPNKTKQYDRYNEPGGFRYYAELERAITALVVGGQPFEQASEPVRGIADRTKREHNLNGLTAFDRWRHGRKVEQYFAPPAGVYPSPSGLLAVKLKPEFGMVERGARKLVAVWNIANAKLTPTVAGVGAHMMMQKLAIGPFSDCTCHVLDLQVGTLYSRISKDAQKLLQIEFATAEDIIKRYDAA